MVLMVQSLMTQNPINHHPSSGPGPHLIIHHQVQVLISSSIIRSSPLLGGCGPQIPPISDLVDLVDLEGGGVY